MTFVTSTAHTSGSPWPSGLVVVVALVAALVATPLAILLARRTGIMDRPGALKLQAEATPYLGGLGVFAGVLVGGLTGHPWVLLGCGAALILGTSDDRFDLPAIARLGGEVIIGILLAVSLPAPGGAPLVGRLFVIVLTVVLINGVNLMDGLDALAGGVGAVAALGFAILLWRCGLEQRNLAFGLLGGLLGFLAFNRPPAKIYLGDGGSYLVGATLAALVTLSASHPHPVSSGLLGVAVVALPAAEIVFAVFRRARGHQPLLAGDRGHPYDRLVQHGWPRPAASAAYIATEVVIVASTLAVDHWRRGCLGWAFGLLGVTGLLLIVLAGLSGGLTPDEVSSSSGPTGPTEES